MFKTVNNQTNDGADGHAFCRRDPSRIRTPDDPSDRITAETGLPQEAKNVFL